MDSKISSFIRDIPDFPKEGILFKDITPLLANAEAFDASIEAFAAKFKDQKIDKIAGMESRGFLFGTPLAQKLGVGFIPIRKPGKLPAETISQSYQLEYGEDSLEVHKDAITPSERVLIIDDLLATGGTAEATGKMIEVLGGKIIAFAFLIELEALNGRKKIENYSIFSLLKY